MRNLKNILKDITDNNFIEDETIELKSSIPLNLSTLAKSIVAMANTSGGYIIIGIQKNSIGYSINGVDKSVNIHKLDSEIYKFITYKTYTIKRERINCQYIIIVQITKSNLPVYFGNKANSERQYKYIRKGSVSIQESTGVKAKLYKKVYKYMNLETFICNMYGGTLRFCEPSKWTDRFETRFYNANYEDVDSDKCAQCVYATCVTKEKDNAAAWKVYSNNTGISTRCVQIEIDILELRNQLEKYKSPIDENSISYNVDERFISYKDEQYILSLHKPKSPDYSKYFTHFTINSFLELLSIKRNAYQFENEIRIFLIPSKQKERQKSIRQAKHIDINVDWSKLIKSIKIDKNCSAAELIAIFQACNHAKIQPTFKNNPLGFEIKFDNDCVKIHCELFDIEKLPTRKRLKINKIPAILRYNSDI